MTREEKDKCLRKLQDIVNRANWGTIERDENGVPLGIRYASDVATAIENDNQADLLKEFVEWLKDRFDKRIDEQAAKCEQIENEGDDGGYLTSYMEYVANADGILTGYVNAKWWLEELDTIEKFMEENKDVEPKESI